MLLTNGYGSKRTNGHGARQRVALGGAVLALALTASTAHAQVGVSFDFGVATNGDLFAIKRNQTGSKSTEVHVLAAAGNYQSFALQTGTALHETDSSFAFAIAPNRDVFAIKRRKTGSKSTEVHVLSAARGYKTFALQTGTALHETDPYAVASGAVVKGSAATVYVVDLDTLRAIPDWGSFLAMGFSGDRIITVPDTVIATARQGAMLPVMRSGALLKGDRPAYYLLENAALRLIPDLETFKAKGYALDKVLVVTDGVLRAIPSGAPIASVKG